MNSSISSILLLLLDGANSRTELLAEMSSTSGTDHSVLKGNFAMKSMDKFFEIMIEFMRFPNWSSKFFSTISLTTIPQILCIDIRKRTRSNSKLDNKYWREFLKQISTKNKLCEIPQRYGFFWIFVQSPVKLDEIAVNNPTNLKQILNTDEWKNPPCMNLKFKTMDGSSQNTSWHC